MSHCFKVYFIFPLSPSPSPCLWLARTLRSQVSLAPGECLATPTTYDVVVKVAADNSALTFTARHRSAANFPVLRRFVQKPTTPEYRSTCEEQNTASVFTGRLCRPLTPRFPRKVFRHCVPAQTRGLICIMTVMNDSSRVIWVKNALPKCPFTRLLIVFIRSS